MSDRLKLPPERDLGFYQRRKHDKWRAVEPPVLEAAVADSHVHIHMLPDPAWELVRCATNGVDFICEICDPSEDGSRPFDEIDQWLANARGSLAAGAHRETHPYCAGSLNEWHDWHAAHSRTVTTPDSTPGMSDMTVMPLIDARIAVGVHPHNAKLYTQAVEDDLVARLSDPHVVALGEIGLDYHYDLSPREMQRRVFRRQIELSKQAGLPIALHLRGGDDPVADNAHREAFEILREIDALGPDVLLHCCALPPDELHPWIEAGCYIAYGGAITFKNADAAREGARLVPDDRLLIETDSPYMTPEPMRGAACTPAHIVFTAAALAEVRDEAPGANRKLFLERLHANTLAFYRIAS